MFGQADINRAVWILVNNCINDPISDPILLLDKWLKFGSLAEVLSCLY